MSLECFSYPLDAYESLILIVILWPLLIQLDELEAILETEIIPLLSFRRAQLSRSADANDERDVRFERVQSIQSGRAQRLWA